ncbi:hypothetical protein BDV96DRAFT_650865 [Lophiotrema nucula]|uniref:Uncharacterized protein n=1 Tax=Lophiotrema nucula TaxID=690887 RepID=A0A6A5YUT6_9PLEO|nr:hypothetical protein BDV96DRAFT_650865 [Lophiotrema nucula]
MSRDISIVTKQAADTNKTVQGTQQDASPIAIEWLCCSCTTLNPGPGYSTEKCQDCQHHFCLYCSGGDAMLDQPSLGGIMLTAEATTTTTTTTTTRKTLVVTTDPSDAVPVSVTRLNALETRLTELEAERETGSPHHTDVGCLTNGRLKLGFNLFVAQAEVQYTIPKPSSVKQKASNAVRHFCVQCGKGVMTCIHKLTTMQKENGKGNLKAEDVEYNEKRDSGKQTDTGD